MESHQSNDRKLWLPNTILTRIISYLDPQSLARAASVNHQFQELAHSDALWKTFINSYLPTPIESCGPAPSFRRLFIALYPYWFIPKFGFWLSDEYPRGQLIIARFNPTLLCIEAWAVVADRENSGHRPWSVDAQVMIHDSDMRVHVDRQNLIFRIGVADNDWNESEKDQGFGRARAAVMYEESSPAGQTRVELSLGHNTPVGGDLAMWPTPDMSAMTSLPAGTSIPGSFRPSNTPTGCHPTLHFITSALTRPSPTEQCLRNHTHPVPKDHGRESGAETTSTMAWSSCCCSNPVQLILPINARACWQSN